VLARLRTSIEERPAPPKGFAQIMVAMLCSFGNHKNKAGHYGENKKEAAARWEGARNSNPKPSNLRGLDYETKAMPQGQPAEHAWRVIKPVLLSRLRVDTAADWDSTGRAIMTDLVNLTELLEIDLAAWKKEADLQVKAPKNWGDVDPHTLKAIKAGKAAK